MLSRFCSLPRSWMLSAVLGASFTLLPAAASLANPLISPPKSGPMAIGKSGGVLTVPVAHLPLTFNNYLAAETSSTDVLGQMYLGMVSTDPLTRQIVPQLAESWTLSPDHRTYTFKLRSGLKWSDGQPLTVDDVVFTYNEIINNPNIPNNYRDGIIMVDDAGEGHFPTVKKIDATHVSFTSYKPLVPFLRALSDPIMPKHVFQGKTQPQADGRLPFLEMWTITAPPNQIVVSGPWKLARLVAGERVELVRNSNYYLHDAQGQSLPYLDKLVFLNSPAPAEEFKLLAQGRVDAVTVMPNQVEQFQQPQASLYNLGPSTGTLFVMLNLSQASNQAGKPVVDPIKSNWFRNKLFRQALASALDKATMIQQIYHGLATPQYSHISQQNPFFDPATPQFGYDLAKAKALLKSAGFKTDAQGKLFDAQGHPVRFSLITNAKNSLRAAACRQIQHDWGQLGITVDYKPEDFDQMVEQIDQTLDWETMMIGLTGSAIEPHSGINSWQLDGSMHMFNMGNPKHGWIGTKPTSYAPWEKQMFELYRQAGEAFEPAKRKALYAQAQLLEADNKPFLFTVNSQSLIGVSNRLGNVYPSIQGGSGLNVLLWNSDHLFVK